jgi:hypothetical protein
LQLNGRQNRRNPESRGIGNLSGKPGEGRRDRRAGWTDAAAKVHLRIMERRQDRLRYPIAQQVEEKMDDRGEEESNDMVEEVQFNKSYTQFMAKILLASKDLDIAGKVHKIILEANKAVLRSSSKLRTLQRRLDLIQNSMLAVS